MSAVRALKSTKTEYTITYPAPRGVDFSNITNSEGRVRFSHLENVYRDYSGGVGMVESIPGFRKILSLGTVINGMYLQRCGGEEFVIIHAGDGIYRFNVRERDALPALTKLKTVRNARSAAYSTGGSVFILDGEKITRVDPSGNASYILDESDARPYIPTTYSGGYEFEQRNLLTELTRQESFVALPEDVAYETPNLSYKITDVTARKCAVAGIVGEFSGALFIPTYTDIGDIKYEVSEIYDYAFQGNTRITSVTVSEGVKRIGKYAFQGCSNIISVSLPDSVKLIDDYAFSSCISMTHLRLGYDLNRFGDNALYKCTELQEIEYALDRSSFCRIENCNDSASREITPGSKITKIRARIKLLGCISAVHDVKINGINVPFYTEPENDFIKSIVLPEISRDLLTGASVAITAYEVPGKYSSSGVSESNFLSNLRAGKRGFHAICECTVAECFDGRVFLSGNPDYPNTVFYSSRDITGNNNPLYFGVFNYFSDGVGAFPVTSMLAAGDSLAVFKSGDDGGGSIYYHTPRDTSINLLPKIYPVSYVHSGISASGATLSFFDDPLFISPLGLMGLDKKKINLERSIACRSHNINARLLSENLGEAVLAKWCGYLFISVGGRGYLADSRALFRHKSGDTEYEWFYLDGIGTYSGERNVFRYSDHHHNGYRLHPDANCPTRGEIYSIITPEGGIAYYCLEGGEMYGAYKTEEMTGGSFSPATHLLSCDDELLFFATKSGDVCVFNNDKRGIAPDELRARDDFDEESYSKIWGGKIHPYFYSFARHAPRYVFSTVYDDGSIPYLTKSSIKNSLTVKLENLGAKTLECLVEADTGDYRESAMLNSPELDFSQLDFSALVFSAEERATLPFKEKLKAWVEKRVTLFTEEYASPVGLWSISYRFHIKGRIKKKKH